ncbi:hypothetical protein PORY_001483 [Pneumocystis oryctolagi]|uniref:Uncharacterized protein n=1 Tax=Pneumocystis oryctolagi TaxID=42067 RepID=A0ACB7CEB9_9ASCO|nr:hypothetical protein PORY_001483 [Pneumocystis oryctolagi]
MRIEASEDLDNSLNTDGERVMWKLSPIKESPHSTRPLDSLFTLFTRHDDSDDKSDKGLDPTIELWNRCKTENSIKDAEYCAPVTPVRHRVSLQRQRAHVARKKRNINSIKTEDKRPSVQPSVTRLIDALRTFLPDSLHGQNEICSQKKQQCDKIINEIHTETQSEVPEEQFSDDFLDGIEGLDELSELSDEYLDQNTIDTSINTENMSCTDFQKNSTRQKDLKSNFKCDISTCSTQEKLYYTFHEKNMIDNDEKNEEYLKEESIKNIEYELSNSKNESFHVEKPLFSPQNNILKQSLEITEKPYEKDKKLHKNKIESYKNESFPEDDICTSFSDDILDEEIEAVLSVLDTNQEAYQSPTCVSENTNKKSLTNKSTFNENNFTKSFNQEKDEKDYSFTSYKVCDIKEQWIDSHGYKGLQKVVFLENNRIIQLRQDWFFTPVEIGDDLYLHGQYEENGVCIVDNYNSLVILNPDYLISCTSVASSYSCIRKTIIREKVKIVSDVSKSQIYGKILHCLFQLCLESNDFKSLDEVGENIENAMEYIYQKFPNLQEWASRYFLDIPGENSYVTTHRQKSCDPSFISINKLLKIEEHIWSPKYGLKGNIDATVQIAVKSKSDLQYLIAPFELKTGNNTKVMEHRAQTILYTLLLSQHYNVNVEFGLLFYLEKGETIQVFAIHNEIRGLIIARNNIAKYLKNYQNLPCMLKNAFTCKRCPVREPCFANESGTGETSGLGDYFDEKTNHIVPKYSTFFQYWDLMLSKEENETFHFRKELWSISSKKREKHGRCLSNLKIKECHFTSTEQEMLENIDRYTYTLEKYSSSPKDNSFLDSEINCGDYIIVSDENGHFSIANGSVIEIELTSITISVNRKLYSPMNMSKDNFQYNQAFEKSAFCTFKNNFDAMKNHENILYRIDKDDFKNGMSLARDNLTKLLYLDDEKRRRELIIDLSPPNFNSNFIDFPNIPAYENLNDSQKEAISKVMTALDYALILGMPGTGKSTTIAYLIQTLIKNNKTVLLASYTHSAIDNILLKLDVEKENVLRLGSIERIHPIIQEKVITEEYVVNSFESFQLKYIKPSIVATTCLGITHSVFSQRTFDYCIIDEASQIVLPICIGPLRFAKKFVLVGDHYQLPPLMRNVDAADQGMEISLFKHLSDANPIATVVLEYQYRMNKDIMLLSNTLIYNGKLKCGNEKIACNFPNYGSLYILDTLHIKKNNEYTCDINKCWIKEILKPGLSVVFANTDYVPAPESRKGDKVQNDIEVELLRQVVICLLSQGVSESNIAVLSIYRSQIKLIRYLLKHFKMIEIDTIDSFQGRDKDCVIISFVRSNNNNQIEKLLCDWRRLNVAFTRAKSKLIFFGSKSTLKLAEIFSTFFDLLTDKQWIYNLPKDAHLLHTLDSLIISKQTDTQKLYEEHVMYTKKNYPMLKTIVHAL